MTQEDYYKILGVDNNAGIDRIKEAYRNLAFECHPDRNSDNPQTAEKMKQINEAYAVLSNSSKRNEYDMLRRQYGSTAYSQFRNTYSEQDIFNGSDIGHIFEEMAKSFGFRGYDEIFREFYGKGYSRFEFKQSGHGGKAFVYGRAFKNSAPGQRPNVFQGKLPKYLFKKITGMTMPENGADIHEVINLTPEQAIQGGPYAYHHRRKSKKLVVKIPSGIGDGKLIRLTGMGKDGKGGGTAGNLYLKVHIRKPLRDTLRDFFRNRTK